MSAGWADLAIMTTSDSVTMGLRPSSEASLAARLSTAAASAFPLVRIELESPPDVADPELDMPALILVSEARCGRGRSVGGMHGDEVEQVEECAFPEDVEQKCGGGEVLFLEQRVQRKLGRRQRMGAVAAQERPLGEDLDVACFVVDVARQPHQHFDIRRMNNGQAAAAASAIRRRFMSMLSSPPARLGNSRHILSSCVLACQRSFLAHMEKPAESADPGVGGAEEAAAGETDGSVERRRGSGSRGSGFRGAPTALRRSSRRRRGRV